MKHLFYSIISFIPILFYLVIIFITTPINFSVKRFLNYFMYGIFSVGILLIFFRVFPYFQDYQDMNIVVVDERMDYLIFFFFVQVGLLEEFAKFFAFTICKRSDKTKINLIDIMVYSGITALGFSFIENIGYGIEYLIQRTFTATLIHLFCGLIAGYFIALGRIPTKKQNTVFNYFLYRYPRCKVYIYSIIGLTAASFLHGLYDLNLYYYNEKNYYIITIVMFIIIINSFIVVWALSKDLIHKQQELSH